MKSIKNLFVIGLTSVVIVGFTACSNDDDEKEVKLPTVFEGKRIAEYQSTQNGYTEKTVFNYDNDKLISYNELEISDKDTYEDKYTIEYNKNQVKVSWKDGSDSEICTYNLNENGFATSAILVTHEEGDVWDTDYTFEYDASGYLTKITEKGDDYADSAEIKWSEGNVISYSLDNRNYSCTYTSDLNKGGILPIDNGWLDMEAELHIAYYAGILGRPTKHLIATQKDYGTESFQYTLDSEGYVKTCTSDRDNSTYNYIFK